MSKKQITLNLEDNTVKQIDTIAKIAGVHNRSMIAELALLRFSKWVSGLSTQEAMNLVQHSKKDDPKPTPIRRRSGTYSLTEPEVTSGEEDLKAALEKAVSAGTK